MKKRSYSSYDNKPYKKPRPAVVPARPAYVPRPMNPERKYFDSTLAVTQLQATAASWASGEVDPATANALFCPVQGTGISDRIGRKVHVLKLKIHGLVGYTAVSAQTAVQHYPFARIIVVQDTQTNGAPLNAEDVMQASATAATANQCLAFSNLANLGRYRILKDKTIMLNATQSDNNGSATTISQDFGNYPFKCNITFRKPVVVHYNATNGGTVADTVDNSFHVIALSTGTSVSLVYQCRVVFVDA